MKNIELIELGLRIKKIRKQKGITQEVLAKKMGKAHTSITRIEKGNVNPSIIFLYQIANGLGIEINELFDKNYLIN